MHAKNSPKTKPITPGMFVPRLSDKNANVRPTPPNGSPKMPRNNEAAISNVERVSRPGCRVYVRRTEIPRVLGGMGINILTTPQGVMTGRQARKQGVGGEVLCQIW